MLIVGSGPGGALLAHSLAGSGLDVVILEAGPPVGVDDFRDDIGSTISQWFWEGGMRTTRGNVLMPTLQGRVLGGGSVFNSAICMRATPTALNHWAEAHGLGQLADGRLDEHYAAIENFLGIRRVEAAVQGRRNELFREGCENLGWSVEAMPRAEQGCTGSARCMLGCRSDAKQSVDKRPIASHLRAGGRVFTSVQVDQVLFDGTRARGVSGHAIDPDTHVKTHPVRITADTVVISGGAINTPRILRASGVTDPAVGDNLRFHPSCFVVGVFDEEVNPWNGATQGYQTLDFQDQGIKIESLWGTPGVIAMRFPTSGKQFKRTLAKYPRTAVFDAWISNDGSKGRVGSLPGDRADIVWDLGVADVRRLQEANALVAELFASSGATQVMHGIHGLPEVMDPLEAAYEIRKAELKPGDLPTGSNHVYGTMAMGDNPRTHGTDVDGRVHGRESLYVCDTSLFPESPGVNPQHTAMALARRMAAHLIERAPRATGTHLQARPADKVKGNPMIRLVSQDAG